MNNTRKIYFDLEAIVWGVLLIWWGVRWMFEFLPNGTGLIGTGLILLGLNLIRSLMSISPRPFTTMLGILAIVFGGLYLANSTLHLPFEIPVFEIMLIVFGAIVLFHAFKKIEINYTCCS